MVDAAAVVTSLSLEEASSVSPAGGGGDDQKGKPLFGSGGYDDQQQQSPSLYWTPERLGWFYALLVAMVPVLMGYDAGVMSGSIADIREDLSLSADQEAVAMAIFNFVAAAGALFSGALGDLVGRKGAIAASAILALLGAAVSTFSESYSSFMWGRSILGFGCGCGFLQAPVYTSEIVPPEVRGRMVALTDLSMNVGIILGFSVSWLVEVHVANTHTGWRYTCGVGGISLPLCILAALLVIPESPRWLISHGFKEAARDVVDMMSHSAGEASETLAGMKQSLAQEQGDGGYNEIFCPQEAFVKRAIVIVLLAGVAQQVNGSETVIYYTPEMLQASGLSSKSGQLGATVAVGVCKMLGDVLAALLLDTWGRRPIMITSSAGVVLSVAGLGCCLLLSSSWAWTLFLLCFYMAVFSLGLGAVTFLIANEVLPIRVRSKCVGLSVFLNRLLAGLTVVAFRTAVEDARTMAAFWLSLFLLGSLVTLAFYWWMLPETANKSLEEIQTEMVAASGSSSSSKPYETIE